MYETMVLIDESVDLKLDKLHDALSSRFSKVKTGAPSIKADEGKLELTWKHFSLQLWLNKDEYVLEESADVAQVFAEGRPDQTAIAACSERIDISGSDDVSMDHFNDYISVLETIEGIGRVYLFDPAAQKFL